MSLKFLADASVPNLGFLIAHFSAASPLVTTTGKHRIYNDTGKTLTIQSVRCSLGTTGTSNTIVDVHKDGTTIFTTQANRPTLGSGTATVKVTNMDVTSWADGSYLTVDIDTVGTGADELSVQVTAKAAG